jgi:hypothetical protein
VCQHALQQRHILHRRRRVGRDRPSPSWRMPAAGQHVSCTAQGQRMQSGIALRQQPRHCSELVPAITATGRGAAAEVLLQQAEEERTFLMCLDGRRIMRQLQRRTSPAHMRSGASRRRRRQRRVARRRAAEADSYAACADASSATADDANAAARAASQTGTGCSGVV